MVVRLDDGRWRAVCRITGISYYGSSRLTVSKCMWMVVYTSVYTDVDTDQYMLSLYWSGDVVYQAIYDRVVVALRQFLVIVI
jgi:hypothetical protein